MSLEAGRQEVGLRTSASRMDVRTRLLLQSLVQLLPDWLPPRHACPGNSRSLPLHTHTLQKKKKWSEFPPKGMAGSVGGVGGRRAHGCWGATQINTGRETDQSAASVC